jgi:preprotein translocase subunit SecE
VQAKIFEKVVWPGQKKIATSTFSVTNKFGSS